MNNRNLYRETGSHDFIRAQLETSLNAQSRSACPPSVAQLLVNEQPGYMRPVQRRLRGVTPEHYDPYVDPADRHIVASRRRQGLEARTGVFTTEETRRGIRAGFATSREVRQTVSRDGQASFMSDSSIHRPLTPATPAPATPAPAPAPAYLSRTRDGSVPPSPAPSALAPPQRTTLASVSSVLGLPPGPPGALAFVTPATAAQTMLEIMDRSLHREAVAAASQLSRSQFAARATQPLETTEHLEDTYTYTQHHQPRPQSQPQPQPRPRSTVPSPSPRPRSQQQPQLNTALAFEDLASVEEMTAVPLFLASLPSATTAPASAAAPPAAASMAASLPHPSPAKPVVEVSLATTMPVMSRSVTGLSVVSPPRRTAPAPAPAHAPAPAPALAPAPAPLPAPELSHAAALAAALPPSAYPASHALPDLTSSPSLGGSFRSHSALHGVSPTFSPPPATPAPAAPQQPVPQWVPPASAEPVYMAPAAAPAVAAVPAAVPVLTTATTPVPIAPQASPASVTAQAPAYVPVPAPAPAPVTVPAPAPVPAPLPAPVTTPAPAPVPAPAPALAPTFTPVRVPAEVPLTTFIPAVPISTYVPPPLTTTPAQPLAHSPGLSLSDPSDLSPVPSPSIRPYAPTPLPPPGVTYVGTHGSRLALSPQVAAPLNVSFVAGHAGGVGGLRDRVHAALARERMKRGLVDTAPF